MRAWSAALNRGDNKAAGVLFATNARFVAGDYSKILRNHQQAVTFNAGLGWCGRIVKLSAKGDEVTARFALVRPRNASCKGQSREHGSVAFRIRDGKIVLFDQIGE